MTNTSRADKAGHEYWDKTWSDTPVPAAFDPYDSTLDNSYYAQLHEYFEKLIAGRKDLKILEIGCAYSLWPSYFKRYHNLMVDGLDYSEIGCKKTRQTWNEQGLDGKMVCADMFSPPADMLGQYDLVLSFGVVEHFQDTAACLQACKQFLKPSGELFTMIPNIAGIIGHLQKIVDRDVYDIHMPLTKNMLVSAHETAGMKIEDASYFMRINLGVVNSGRHAGKPIDRLLRRILSLPTKLLWVLERFGICLPMNAYTSPYIYVLARF